jgi:3-hydroxyisobutyrate dehydrogenase-like beta-hydroxyacid dehydrogenase
LAKFKHGGEIVIAVAEGDGAHALEGRVQQGHLVVRTLGKLAANHWMITMVAALAETMRLCERMDLDEQQFIALLDDGLPG